MITTRTVEVPHLGGWVVARMALLAPERVRIIYIV